MFNVEEELKNIPDSPGVYIMKNKNDEIIYVGKAISLKKRIRSYFQSSKNQHPKVAAMVSHINDLEYIMVDNEVESLVLESNLIKKHRPKYNILLRDDKQYPYIKVTLNERYPRVLKTRRILKDGAKYFGPYPSATAVNDALDTIKSLYPIRTCKLNFQNDMARFKPCLNYYIGRCNAPCLGKADEGQYMEMIDEIIQFLNNKDDKMVDIIEKKMKNAAANLEFEAAARYRNQLSSLRTLQEKQKIVTASSSIDQDIIAMARGIEEVCVQIFFVRAGQIVGREHYILEDIYNEARSEILSSFMKQFYIGSAYVPKEIILEEEIEDNEAMAKWLQSKRGSKVSLIAPKRGDKLELIEMVRKNAKDMLNQYGDKFLKKYRENLKALEEIRHILELDEVPARIEAYDISNISGVQSVGSMIVFENGEAKKSDYRRFKIRSVQTPNDYASLDEVLRRRFIRGIEEKEILMESDLESKGFSTFPDLIMMDGGKGQVNIALKVLEELGINIPVCGLVKDDFHKTRGIIYNGLEYHMEEDSRGFRMIYKIQEEAHRFAISYHRSLRTKDMFLSELDDIKGIGEKRKTALMKHFQGIDRIKNASVEELVQVEGMNIKAAEEVYYKFHKREVE